MEESGKVFWTAVVLTVIYAVGHLEEPWNNKVLYPYVIIYTCLIVWRALEKYIDNE